MTADQRIRNEIEHGKHLREIWSGSLWYWETAAGKIRWQRRLQMLTSHIEPSFEVLELGCAVGYFTEELAKTNAKITAIDISPDLLEVAIEKIKAPNVVFKVENAYDMTFEDGRFDSVVGSSVLHHLDVDQALKEFKRVLKPGGTIYFTEPNWINPQIYLERKIPALREKFGTSPDEIAFVRWKLKKQLAQYGFVDIEILPFDFLHPATPKFLIPAVKGLGDFLEHVPLVREIAGSLYIKARQPE